MPELLLHDPAPPPDPAVVRRFGALPTAAVSDVLERQAGAPGLLPIPGTLPPGAVVAGPALTVRTTPGDNLAIHRALDLAEPDDVLVVDGRGYAERAVLGGLLARYAARRGVAAIVVDGAVRDVSDLVRTGLPVLARAVTHVGPWKNGPGELRGLVSCAGAVVAHGDVVVVDEDGVAVVPAARAEEAATAAEALVAAEAEAEASIDAGAWHRPWVDALTVRRAPARATGDPDTPRSDEVHA